MSARVLTPSKVASGPADIVHSHFDAQQDLTQPPWLAWRDRVGHVIDVLPTKAEMRQPFQARIDRYKLGNIMFTDCRSDAMTLKRSLTRISTDQVRDIAFQVFAEGGVDNLTVRTAPTAPLAQSRIVALDMDQPVQMRRGACRVITLFLPADQVAQVFPDPSAIHGRALQLDAPTSQLAYDQVVALADRIATLGADDARRAVQTSAQLLLGAFGRQAGFSGNARAAARAGAFAQVRRYIKANLHQADLSPETVLNALQLPRPSLYRLFQHEGGLAAYIRHLRLRHAADDLVAYPNLAITDIAFGLGFKSASDFTRSFRRAYDMAPQDFRHFSRRVA